MDRAERAKQFMPFAALKGYEEALRERERQMTLMERKKQIPMQQLWKKET